jgi:hypothetical protein
MDVVRALTRSWPDLGLGVGIDSSESGALLGRFTQFTNDFTSASLKIGK